jgi:hypothetical protein
LGRKPPEKEFDVESNQINLIFLHTLSGVGVFYCPLLPIIVLIRLLITFYWKKVVLKIKYTVSSPFIEAST